MIFGIEICRAAGLGTQGGESEWGNARMEFIALGGQLPLDVSVPSHTSPVFDLQKAG